MRNDKQRLFEVMGHINKTFKPKLNEDFGIEEDIDYLVNGWAKNEKTVNLLNSSSYLKNKYEKYLSLSIEEWFAMGEAKIKNFMEEWYVDKNVVNKLNKY